MAFHVIDAPQRRPLLTRLRESFVVKEDGSLLWIKPPKNHPDLMGQSAGTPTPNRHGKVYWLVQIDGRKYRRAQIVFYMVNGAWPTPQVDHIDGNSTNDRPSNLRVATQTQNAWNHKSRAKRSPLPMGVRQAVFGRYVARISVNKAHLTIGTFDSPEMASRAYQEARRKHFGAFA